MLKLLAFVLCIASLVGRSEQAVLTCNLTDAGNPEHFQPDVRICDGFSNNTSNLMMYGSTQTLTVLELLNVNTYGGEVGVCYSTSVLGCYRSGQTQEDCDNFIRDVIDLNGNCSDTDCKVLVCGTNALRAQCTFCEYDGTEITCDFDENVPAQSLPYNASIDAGYSSCANNNTDGVGIFQFRKDDNATFLYDVGSLDEDLGKIYYGLLKSDSQRNSIIGLASINKTTGEITGEVTTRTDSQKVVATEAHFMDNPFIRGDYVYFLFREPSQEFASMSQGQDPVINRYYSRIARICKDDQGVSVSSTLILTSFLKQRLVCSRTNEYNEVLEFNDIQDFEVREDEDTIHAIFTSARDDVPLSALCTFNLTAIDRTFETGDFFGADGGTTNDRWRANSGAAITPRPGLSCSNPNTGNTNFQRDYNLMEEPAVQTNVPIFLEGDRFSQLSMNGTDYMYIIASERGCLYSVPIGSNVTIEPCEVPGMPAPIEDLEIASNKLLVTANDNVAVSDYNNCSVEPELPTDPCNLSPPGGSYVVRPNARFDIIYDATLSGSPTIEQGVMVVTDSNIETAHLLIRNESLDLDGSLMHLGILILDETIVNFAQVPNCIYNITTYAHYTIGELEKRCDDYDAASAAHSAVNDSCADATMNNKGTFSSAILLNYNQVIDCENCAYSDCKDQC